jgi:hypothetical protein
MTFSIPAEDAEGAVGASYLIECSVTYTVGSRTETAATTAVIGVVMDSGVVPGCLGETTERGVYGWLQLLNSGASGALSAPATDYESPYSSGSVVAWTNGAWVGPSWFGVGASAAGLPAGGFRLGLGAGYSIAQKLASGSDAAVFYAYAGGSGTTDALFCDAGFRTIYADVGTSWVFQVDGDQRFAISDGAITFGPAALCPTSGEWRVRNGWNVRGFMASEAGGSALLAYSGATPNVLGIGDGYYLDHVTVAASTYLAFYAGSGNEVIRFTPATIDCKGKALTNFRSGGTAAAVAVTNDSAPHTVIDHPFVCASDEMISIGLLVRVWPQSGGSYGSSRVVCDIFGTTAIQNTPATEQDVTGAMPTGVTVTYSCPTANVLRVAVTATSGSVMVSVSVWHQPSEEMTLPE